MKNAKRFFLLLSLLAFLSTACVNTKYTLKGFDKKANQYVNKKNNKGLVVAYAKDGEIHWKGYGVKSDTDASSPDMNSVFEIGAVTQVFISSLLMQMAEERLFDPADCANQHLATADSIPSYYPVNCIDINIKMGESDKYDRRYAKKITNCYIDYNDKQCLTLCQLASHTSGLRYKNKRNYNYNPLGKKPDGFAFKDQSMAAMLAQLSGYTIGVKPGDHYFYSSTNMAILANALEQIKGVPYESMLKRYFFKPLGMQQTTFAVADQKNVTAVQGHDINGLPVALSKYDASKAAAGLLSSAKDLMIFLRAQTDYNQSTIDGFKESHKIVVDIFQLKHNRALAGAYGWLVLPLRSRDGVDIYWMNGGTAGYQTFIAFEKETNSAAVLLSNSATNIDELGIYMMEVLASKVDENWQQAQHVPEEEILGGVARIR